MEKIRQVIRMQRLVNLCISERDLSCNPPSIKEEKAVLKFDSPLIVVNDMTRSRHFYEEVLGQKVKFDFGPNVPFEGFSLHLKSHFQSLLGDAAQYPVTPKAHWGELYFETDELESIQQRLEASGVEFIHPVCEQPWGQRVMRFYDPDGHIIEIGETMETVVWRFYEQGLSMEAIVQRSSMPREYIEHVIQEHAKLA
jgi:catechol 2,3-dioxygenase-like lactoylglutathione lyase family enzyme